MDLHMVMSRFGEVMDVYVPLKLKRSGKRYAFVRFRNNVDIRHLILSINSMNGVGVNITAKAAKARMDDNSRPSVSQETKIVRAARTDDRSFVEAVRSQSGVADQDFVPKYGAHEWLSCCALGVLKSPMSFQRLKVFFPSKESPVTEIIPLGGVSFLFKFGSKAERNAMISDQPEWFMELFDVFKEWEDGDAAHDRLCWVLVKGVPPGAWFADFFHLVMTKVGDYVDWSHDTMSRKRFDVAKILIRTTSMSFVNRSFSVQFGDQYFSVGIVESHLDPLDWE
ncbi:hypothetical protein Tsubulata_041265 [Turnera subulata]|uniref:RRM domain-containing protein n=1 Tax=Turnera subulata TaxID=218843 RepID=A0A9Q0FRY4_9ROSI|nr:hypothetical protein Tsubulata_041265 [Turnera subulata]